MSQVSVKSFEQIYNEVRAQIEANCFSEDEQGKVDELCLIIAEIYRLPPECPVRIGRGELPCGMVSEIYLRLRYGHIREVMRKFSGVSYPIKYKKTYLRTALYNEVFEHESGIANGVSYMLLGKG